MAKADIIVYHPKLHTHHHKTTSTTYNLEYEVCSSMYRHDNNTQTPLAAGEVEEEEQEDYTNHPRFEEHTLLRGLLLVVAHHEDRILLLGMHVRMSLRMQWE